MLIRGTPGDDPNLLGTATKDDFDLSAGGNDTASGLGGNDRFAMLDTFNAADSLDGGTGHDTIDLDGDYSAGLTLDPTTIHNIEAIVLGPFSSYNLTLDDGNVAPGARLLIDGRVLQPADHLILDGSNVKGGNLTIFGGAGDDTLTGGSGKDVFYLQGGGSDTTSGGNGNDTFKMRGGFDGSHVIDGGAGHDVVTFKGDYLGMSFNSNTITNVEALLFFGGFDYNFTLHGGNVAAGQRLVINAQRIDAGHSLTLDGSNETDGHFLMFGGAGADTLIGGFNNDTIMGGGGDDLITGGLGADKLTGGAGADTFIFIGAGDSSSTTYDTIKDFAAGTDKIDLPVAVTGVFADFGSVSSASFNTSIQFIDPMHVGGATVISASDGDLIGHTFLVVDGDGNTNYNPGVDYVMDITGFTGTFTTGDFI